MTEPARRDDADGVITVTFTRDEKMNAVNQEMFDILGEAVSDLASQDDKRVMVIRAEGRYFTSGVDIRSMPTNLGEGTDGVIRGSTMRSQYRTRGRHDLFDEMEQVEKPIVLAAKSHCWGVGVEFGVSCDFRLASTEATFSLPEIPMLATIPGSGGISRLTRLVGPHWTRWLAMAGEHVDADTARLMGLVHAVYPVEDFDAQVDAFVARLIKSSREALGLAKISIDVAAGADRRTARQFDRIAQTTLFQSPEFQANVAAFSAGNRKL